MSKVIEFYLGLTVKNKLGYFLIVSVFSIINYVVYSSDDRFFIFLFNFIYSILLIGAFVSTVVLLLEDGK